MIHASHGIVAAETWMGTSAAAVALASTQGIGATTPQSTANPPANQSSVALPNDDLTVEIPNVMLAADMVSANNAVLQRAASAYQAIVAMGAGSTQAQQSWPDEIGPADPTVSIA